MAASIWPICSAVGSPLASQRHIEPSELEIVTIVFKGGVISRGAEHDLACGLDTIPGGILACRRRLSRYCFLCCCRRHCGWWYCRRCSRRLGWRARRAACGYNDGYQKKNIIYWLDLHSSFFPFYFLYFCIFPVQPGIRMDFMQTKASSSARGTKNPSTLVSGGEYNKTKIRKHRLIG